MLTSMSDPFKVSPITAAERRSLRHPGLVVVGVVLVALLDEVGLAMLVDLPIIGGLITRSQEYTADAHARRLHPEGGLHAVAVTATCRDNFPHVDPGTTKREATHRAGFFLWWTNLTGGHPIIPWRIHALLTPGSKGRVIRPPEPRAEPGTNNDLTTP